MAGEVVETLGEKLKRLQAELLGGRSNPFARLAFATLVHDPAFADYVLGLERENRQLREQLIGPQKQPASVRQIEAQTKSAANQLAEAVQAQSRDLTSNLHGDESQEG
jgi:hypothetical protein